jgi:hypothetical protein
LILVIIIISLVILLVFLANIFLLKGDSKDKICAASINARNSLHIGMIEFKEPLLLQCWTKKICLTSKSSGQCENLVSTEDNPLEKKIVNNKEQLLNVLADQLYNDSIMIGEGKKNPLPRGWSKTTYCMITSRIVMDKTLNIPLTNLDLLLKLDEKKNEKGVSYLKAIYNLESAEQFIAKKFSYKDNPKANNWLNEPIDLSKNEYMIATRFILNGNFASWGTRVGSTGVLLIGTPLTLPFAVVAGLASDSVENYFLSELLSDDSEEKKDLTYMYLAPSLYLHNSDSLKALGCEPQYMETIV